MVDAVDELHRLWGQNILRGRKALKMSQFDLAVAVGVTPPSVCRWEAGAAAPRDRHKIQLATVLHQDVRQLFPLVRVSV